MTGHIAPSILSADFKCLAQQLKQLEAVGIRRIHIDVMDGMFVPNISIGFPVIRSIRSCTDMEFDVHLMVEEPGRYIEETADCGADYITVHQEACRHLSRVISQIKAAGCKAGVALNPATPARTLRYVAQDIDQVILMTVNPGFGGQKFIPGMMEMLVETKAFFQEINRSPAIELDGGITSENANSCIEHGADYLVAGSAVFVGNIQENVIRLSGRNSGHV